MSKHSLKGKVVLINSLLSRTLAADGAMIEDIVPLVKFPVTDGWWIAGQTIFAHGGYTTR